MSAAGSGTGGVAVAVASVALVTVAVVALVGGPRPTGYLLAAVLAGAALARAVLPIRLVGPFAVRSRGTDVTVCLALALALALVSFLAPS